MADRFHIGFLRPSHNTMHLAVSAAAAAVFLGGFLDTTVHAIAPIEIKGNRLFEYGTDKPFIAKGLDYYPRPNAGLLNINNFDFFTDDHESIWKPHVAEFIALGINAVRLYAVDPSKSHDKFMCALSNAGIYVLIDLASSCEDCAITKDPYPACYPAHLKTRGQQIIAAFSKYNNVLAFSAGNEVNHYVSTMEINAPCQKKFIRDMRAYISGCDTNMRNIPVGVVLADHERSINALYYACRTDPTDELENAEWYGLNAYLQCDPLAALNPKEIGAGYRNLLSDFTAYQLAIPTLLTEYGCLNVGFPTVDGYAAQRTWLDATWLLSPAFADVFAGGFAFEFLTENQNSKADSPYPFKTFGAQNYGLGYFEPEGCDADSTPCVFHRMPNFDYLAKQYSNATMDHLVGRSAYTPAHTTLPKCPADVPSISGVLWPADKETDMLCPDLTQTPLCPGDVINTGKGSTIKPSVKTVVPVRGVPTVTPSSSMAPPTHETTQGTSAAAASNMLGVIVMAGAAIFAGYV
ncbi:hypothetical protein H310_05061 [Aphanomyces invadans]|uniref:Glycoside hydrolase family 2 catalytic domain-containing protein n=1 Tax=Aphanomyces invadans TaxID=157072 RepID=A0A024UCQ3_9STRA|nr:hypothetical protein H310_05061 [Aphanomyces invadans]ETW03672.1 hypothetical protein H310_05061 [Aphanomyces invadans]|eukprot:XP_008867901.1 hypothetical protein H310_05061 [Aphanomyces invadans]